MKGPSADALDACQDALIKIYVKLDHYDPTYSPEPWIITITFRALCNQAIRFRNEETHLRQKAEKEQMRSRTKEHDQLERESKHKQRVLDAILQLPELEQQCVLMHFSQGMSYKLIADTGLCDERQAKLAVRRGLRKLGKALKDLKKGL